ncbi:MAG TPA: hypothetical protein VEI97_08040, partial [bacterium]|nr:hypothetical protein [bacterium]
PDVKQTFASNRWVQTQSLDERQYSTIHTAGRLVCTADMLRGLKSIDDLRWVVTPPVPNDFTRTSARYTVQADGLALDYDFMDEERYLSPPAGATRLRGTYTRSTNNFGARYLCEVSIRLEGKKGEPKRRLMATAIAVALDKLVRARPLVGGQVMIRDGMFRETLDENVVEVVLRAMAADTAQAPNSKVVQAVGELGGRLAVQGAVGAAGPLAQAAQAVANVLAQQREKPAGANPAADAAAGKLSPVVGLDLSQFDGRLLGCSTPPQLDGTFKPGAGIAPELFGNLPKLRMIAAALNDPCLAQTSANQERVSPGDRPAGEFLAMTTAERLAYQPAPPQTRHAAPVVELTPKLPPRMLSSAAQNYDSPGVWEEFSCLMLNAYDSVRHVLPATSEGVPGKVCRTHNPTCDLVVTWTARKWGGKPTVPSWADSADGNLICTRHFVGTEEPELGPDGETIGWTISGEYRYSYLDATVATVRDPIPPWLPVSASQADKYPTTGTVIHGAQSSTLRSR